MESATLKVNSTGKSVPSLAPCFPENTEELPAEDAEIVSPQSPTLYYHPLHAHSHRSPHSRESHTRIVGCITGLPCSLEYSRYLTNLCDVSEYENAAGVVETLIKVNPDTFTPGSIVVFKTWMLGSGREAGEVPESVGASVDGLNVTLPVLSPLSISTKGELEGFWALMGLTNSSEVLDIMFRLGYDVSRTNSLWFKDLPWPPGLMDAVSSLTLEEINVTMFRSSLEETDTIGIGLYEVPEFGTLSYGGLQGFITPLLEVARNNDLGHPICENVRSGPWMIDYISDRLKRCSFLKLPLLDIAA